MFQISESLIGEGIISDNRISDSHTAFKYFENAIATGTPALPYMYALQCFINNDKRLPREIDGKDHLEDLADRCFAHDAHLRLKELNEQGIETIDNPVKHVHMICLLANFAGKYGKDIDVAALEKKIPEAHGIMARKILKEFSEDRLYGREVPLAYNAFTNHYAEALKGPKPFSFSPEESAQIKKFSQESVKNASILAKAIFYSLSPNCRSDDGWTASHEIARQASRGLQNCRL